RRVSGRTSPRSPGCPLPPANATSPHPIKVGPLPFADDQRSLRELDLETAESRALTTISNSPEPVEAEAPASIEGIRRAVREPAPETVQSRILQRSARRRLWSTLLDYRDWVSYLYVPILVPILIVLPYYGEKCNHAHHVAQQLIESVALDTLD